MPDIPDCTHLADGPAVVTTALWLPGRLACPDCAPHLYRGPDEPGDCDRCDDTPPSVHDCITVWNQMVILYGLCDACMFAEHTEPGTPRRPGPTA